VHQNDETVTTKGWADAADKTNVDWDKVFSRVTYENNGKIEKIFYENHKDTTENAKDDPPLPRNPNGRTGMKGRGVLGRYGPNHAADPIVTRYDPTNTGHLQMVAIKRKDQGDWAIPGGMVDVGELVSDTIRREFEEEAASVPEADRPRVTKMLDQLFGKSSKLGQPVFEGYVDDPRNTDNSWMETTAMHFHCDAEMGALMQLAGQESETDGVQWLTVTDDNENFRNLYASHGKMVVRVIEMMKESRKGKGSFANEERLRRWLEENGVPAEKMDLWGSETIETEPTKTIKQLWGELEMGETELHTVNKKAYRHVHVAKARVKRAEDPKGRFLYEQSQIFPNGNTRERRILLSEKLQGHEPFHQVRGSNCGTLVHRSSLLPVLMCDRASFEGFSKSWARLGGSQPTALRSCLTPKKSMSRKRIHIHILD
jgi:8-oxo-dGTP pyrophosphatase MutT (NUDIX family)